jgi:AraC-like DNA-binding protein
MVILTCSESRSSHHGVRVWGEGPAGPMRVIVVQNALYDIESSLADCMMLCERCEDESYTRMHMASCTGRPTFSTWVCRPAYRTVECIAAGHAYQQLGVRRVPLRFEAAYALRHLWHAAWGHWLVEMLSDQSTRSARQPRLSSDVFGAALRSDTVLEFASRCGLTPKSLRHLMRRCNVRSPCRFLLLARAFTAWEMLRAHDESLERVAYALGYSSLPAFSRSMRRAIAVQPKTLRYLTDLDLFGHMVSAARHNQVITVKN